MIPSSPGEGGLRSLAAGLLLSLVGLGGCAAQGSAAPWGPRWPSPGELGDAALATARSPTTWAPLAAAAVLSVGDLDQDLSSWAADHQPLFGSGAESRSDDLRTAATAAWLITALVAPSDTVGGKLGGLAVGAGALGVENAVTDGIKRAAGRERPDGSDDRSFSSGHAGASSAAATLARRNLDYLNLPGWMDTSLRLGLYGIAAGTGWARVEAEKHYVTDVLVGHAVGHFVAGFLHQAFMVPAAPAMALTYRAVPGGGALTLTLGIGARR